MSKTEGFTKDPAQSPLLARLLRVLPAVRDRLDDNDAWRGFVVSDVERQTSRGRLVCVDRIVDRALGRTYALSAHHFDVVGTTALHDHRYPLAVFAFAVPATPEEEAGGALYDMPVEVRDGDAVVGRDHVVVGHGDAWAIVDPRRVWHAVLSRRRHGSILLADVTDAPTRGDRLTSKRMSDSDRRATCALLARHLDRALASR